MTTTNVVRLPDNTRARRLTNLEHAKLLIKSGLYIFVSSGKTPLIPRFNKIDTQLTEEEREAAIEKYKADHGEDPIHVGATKNPSVVTEMFKKYPDAVWSIACGPSKLVVIDADKKDKGPELIGKHFEEHGQPEGCVVVPTQSGGRHYIFKDPDGKFTNSAGLLKKNYGCDVRGVGGQYIAPGSIRQDGKTYGTRKDLIAFLNAYVHGKLPELPGHVVELIGAGGEAAQSVDDEKLAATIKELDETEWPTHEDLFDPTIGIYDLDALRKSNPEFAELYDNPSSDCSDNRWKLTQMVMPELNLPVVHLAVLYEGWAGAGTQTDDGKGAGNYNLRDIGREWEKNKNRYASKGDAFGAVVDDEDDDDGTEGTKPESNPDTNAPKPPKVETWYTNATHVPVNLDIDALPPRPYIYGTYLQRGHVTLLSASGGVGKSAWALSVGIDLACGVDHLGAGDFKHRKVLVYNAEDDTQEMLRRAGAYMRFHNFTTEMRKRVGDNLTIISGVNGALQFAGYRDGRVLVLQNSVNLFGQMLQEREIEVAMLDPLVSLHSIPENANSEMNKLIAEIKAVTASNDIATLVSHHDKKNIGGRDVEDASQDDARGAGTITTPMRVVLSMKRLSKSDVKRLNIPAEDVPRVVALSKGAKSNYSARDTGSRLFFTNSVQANNGSDEFKADSTVALSVYKLRAAGPQITDEQRDAILAEIAKSEFRSDAQANAPIVQFITDVAGMDSDADGKRYVSTLLIEWAKLGWITKEKAKVKGHKREVPVYKLGPDQPPAARVGFEAVEDEDE